jgi:hypothetical protein
MRLVGVALRMQLLLLKLVKFLSFFFWFRYVVVDIGGHYISYSNLKYFDFGLRVGR